MNLAELITQVEACTICQQHLPLGCNPVFSVATTSKILIIGQAPGRIVHQTNIPWNDKSGDNLRAWLGVDKTTFYNTNIFGTMPMGFCYPGTGKTGDLPPRPECATTWHKKLINNMPDIQLVLLIGQYAQNYYLCNAVKSNLTNTTKAFKEYLPKYFPLPHPSPRNNIWIKKNKWFAKEILPVLRNRISLLC